MTLDEYRNSAIRLTAECCTDPTGTVRGWAKLFDEIFSAMLAGRKNETGAASGKALFEPCSLVVARWEFLGCLLTGHSKQRSGRSQAMRYAKQFLEPINPRYGHKHPTILPRATLADLLFQMLRNASLHGFVPAGVYDPSTNSCIACGVDYSSPTHLEFDGRATFVVDSSRLLRELVDSMTSFAAYLEENRRTPSTRLPRDDFREGYRWRVAPSVAAAVSPYPWEF